jgi:hypothetical protein
LALLISPLRTTGSSRNSFNSVSRTCLETPERDPVALGGFGRARVYGVGCSACHNYLAPPQEGELSMTVQQWALIWIKAP